MVDDMAKQQRRQPPQRPIPKVAGSTNPPTHEEDPLLSPSEVARAIGKHQNTIYNWIRDGLLKATRHPTGRIVVRRSEVNKLLANSALETQV